MIIELDKLEDSNGSPNSKKPLSLVDFAPISHSALPVHDMF